MRTKLLPAKKGEEWKQPHEHWRFCGFAAATQRTGWFAQLACNAVPQPAIEVQREFYARLQAWEAMPAGARNAWKTSLENNRPRLVRRMRSPDCCSSPSRTSSAIA